MTDHEVEYKKSSKLGELDSEIFKLLEDEPVDVELIPIDTLSSNHGDWTYTLPTLISKGSIRNTIQKEVEIKNLIFTNHQLLAGLNLKNLFIAGGLVSHYALYNTKYRNDVDIFMFGLSDDELISRAEQLISELNMKYDKLLDMYIALYIETEYTHSNIYKPNPQSLKTKWKSIKSIKNKNCINITYQINKFYSEDIQIILGSYSSIRNILSSFDIGSSKIGLGIGFDAGYGPDVIGNREIKVVTTPLGKFAFENPLNIVDPKKNNPAYVKRLQKYFSRGYGIVLPNLNMNELSRSNLKYGYAEICELPYFGFVYNKIVGQKIYVKKFIDVPKIKNPVFRSYWEKSKDIIRHNIIELLHKEKWTKITDDKSKSYPNFYVKLDHEADLNSGVILTNNEINTFYNGIYQLIINSIFAGKYDFQIMKEFVTIIDCRECFAKIYDLSKEDKYTSDESKSLRDYVINDIIRKQKDESRRLLKQAYADKLHHITWIDRTNGKPYEWEFIEPADWYGKYFGTDFGYEFVEHECDIEEIGSNRISKGERELLDCIGKGT